MYKPPADPHRDPFPLHRPTKSLKRPAQSSSPTRRPEIDILSRGRSAGGPPPWPSFTFEELFGSASNPVDPAKAAKKKELEEEVDTEIAAEYGPKKRAVEEEIETLKAEKEEREKKLWEDGVTKRRRTERKAREENKLRLLRDERELLKREVEQLKGREVGNNVPARAAYKNSVPFMIGPGR